MPGSHDFVPMPRMPLRQFVPFIAKTVRLSAPSCPRDRYDITTRRHRAVIALCSSTRPLEPSRERDEMTTATNVPDLAAIKTRQQQMWASGDFAVVASRIVLVSELLADSTDIRAGWSVLDVACGNGN